MKVHAVLSARSPTEAEECASEYIRQHPECKGLLEAGKLLVLIVTPEQGLREPVN